LDLGIRTFEKSQSVLEGQAGIPFVNEGEDGTCGSLDEREGQSLEDATADRANVNFGLFESSMRCILLETR
jgi:hypothetical protein